MHDHPFIEHLQFGYSESQRAKFIDGKLGLVWADRYPDLFDEKDRKIYVNQCDLRFHFFEWLAAILIYEATGYLSLVEKYMCKDATHPRKAPIYRQLVPSAIDKLEKPGWPDLLCYSPDRTDWYFCEVKGGPDDLRPEQISLFREFYELTGKKVRVLWLKEMAP